MRGIPNNPIRCKNCGFMKACLGDGLCHRCRMLARPNATRRFEWTQQLDEILQRAYKNAHTRNELSKNITSLQRYCGFSRNVILARAVALGLSFSHRRPWTGAEIKLIEEKAGQETLKTLAVTLGRTHSSIKAKVRDLNLRARVSEGYSKEDLRQLLGVGPRSIQHWLQWGWLRVVDGRIPEASVIRFLRSHSDQYHLGRVDQAWFKGLLFPSFNSSERRSEFREALTPRAIDTAPNSQEHGGISAEFDTDADVA